MAEFGEGCEYDLMQGIVVVTGLDQLPSSARWPRLVAPFAAELTDSGLGQLLDLDTLQGDAVGGSPSLTEVAVDLVNLDYGRQLIRRVVEEAGIRPRADAVPERWRRFGCSDYFGSSLAERGYWDEAGQYWYVWPSDRVYEAADRQFLVIGGPGVDGIDWGYRADQTGLWAYYPIGREFVWLAPTADALLQGWGDRCYHGVAPNQSLHLTGAAWMLSKIRNSPCPADR